MRLSEQNIAPQVNDAQAAIIAGQILGADFFGVGSVDKIGKSYAVSMQIVEVRSGRVIKNQSEFYKGNFKKFQKLVIPYFAKKLCGIPVDEKPPKK